MDYSEIINELNKASSFDLFRLQGAIAQELENPLRITEIKKQLNIGQKISYFDVNENRLVDAIIIEIRRTRCLVENKENGKRWNMPFSHLNLDNVDTDIRHKHSSVGIEKNVLKVGDKVGFKNKHNKNIYGTVIRLNQKSATIEIKPQQQWRVHYSFLFFVFEENMEESQYI